MFDAPWQGRVFGMAKTLADSGVFTWDEFRVELIERIAEAEKTGAFDYYSCFQKALESILEKQDLVENPILESKVGELAARPHGHG